MPRHQVVFGPFNKDAFFHEWLHEAQHIPDIPRRHWTDRFVVIAIDHRSNSEVGENLAQDRSFHAAVDDVGAFRSLAAGGQREGEVLQIRVRVAGVEAQDFFGLLETESRDATVAVLDQTRRKLESWLHESVAVRDEKELLSLKSLGYG